MSCTIVTAFYPIKSKFSKDQYLQWGATFMRLESPIVMFTEEQLIPELTRLRENRPIKFVALPFNELDTWKLYKDKWIENHKIDPENAYHTPELYAIWAQKAFFVEQATKTNNFNTDYFFWCDFGAFRNPNINPVILQSFPQTKYFNSDKILFQAINDISDAEKVIKEDGIYGEKISSEWNDVRLVGGLWGGSINACFNWKKAYQKMLEMYFSKGRFAGKDQIVMLSTYLANPDTATIVKCTLANVDEWFFFEYLLSTMDVRYELNNSYIIQKDSKPIVSVNIMGGLGNQMFQLATAYAYARKNNGSLKVIRNKRENDGRPLYWDSFLSRFDKYLVDSVPNNLSHWRESSATEYCTIPDLNSNGIFLNGYLQSPKYFNYNSSIEQEINDLFAPRDSVIHYINDKYSKLLQNRGRVIVIHARRTDYCRNQDIINYHGPLTADYYKKAIKRMCESVSNPIFLLVSDDPNYWIDIFEDIPELDSGNICILNNESDINIIGLLQQFNYFIIANSTFSWWAAWLSKGTKKVIAPSKWFGPTGNVNYKDIYVPSWELI